MSSPSPTDLAGTEVADRFRLTRHVRSSAYGEHWYARDRKTKKQVEVLFMHPVLFRNREENFGKAHVQGSFTHPHATSLLHFERHPVPLRVTSWEKHEPLIDLLGERLLLSTGVTWIAQIADALAAAHAQELVHGGISPHHIHIVHRTAPPGEARLAGWGLLRLFEGADPTSTGVPEFAGAPWVSPEYARGMPPTPASDIYALGTVLYHCACGQPVFSGPSMKVIASHVTELPQPPSARASDVPHWLDDLLLAMLSKDPDKRPSAAAVRERLLEGMALLVDQAARIDRVTANAAPTRKLPEIALRGAHHTAHLPRRVEPAEDPLLKTEMQLLAGLLVVAGLLLGLIAGIALMGG